MGLRESLDDPVSEYMMEDYATAEWDDSIVEVAKAMKDAGSTEALVVKGGKPVGIVTERDILYKVVAPGARPAEKRVGEIMSSPVETVDASSRVGDAIAKMSKLGFRRLGVTKGGRLVGMINQKQVVSGGRAQRVPLPELSSPNGVSCPYCGASMKDGNMLSTHIDQVHLGLGLLEGNKSRW